MKERPILFSGSMVRAILDGRKTQTRRIVKHKHMEGEGAHINNCPYGKVGHQLWVRETFSYNVEGKTVYRADCPAVAEALYKTEDPFFKWKPSIHMPRVASRIQLKIIDIRVERLQDISEDDAKAEGVEPYDPDYSYYSNAHKIDIGEHPSFRGGFYKIWEKINGLKSWNQNPWVWVVEFERF